MKSVLLVIFHLGASFAAKEVDKEDNNLSRGRKRFPGAGNLAGHSAFHHAGYVAMPVTYAHVAVDVRWEETRKAVMGSIDSLNGAVDSFVAAMGNGTEAAEEIVAFHRKRGNATAARLEEALSLVDGDERSRRDSFIHWLGTDRKSVV